MRSFGLLLLSCIGMAVVPMACVDLLDQTLHGTVDVLVVDGTITNLAEDQIIWLNHSRADPLTGRFGVLPITKASVDVVLDSSQVIACHETLDGRYQLPSDFKGQVGHAYQLRFTLSDGTQYQSSQQVMQPVPPIGKVSLQFNPTSLPASSLKGFAGLLEGFRAGFDVLLDVQDPIAQQNYYRWNWNLYEKQDWCRSCSQGYYMTNKLSLVSSYPNILVYQTQPDLLEDCFAAPAPVLSTGYYSAAPYFLSDYVCRTQCWDIIGSSTLSLFSDEYSNGGLITGRNVGQVPYYTQNHALVEIRQTSLTADAYRYFSLFAQQTQNTGGLTDGPPTALVGNVHNTANSKEAVVGYFTTSAVSSTRYWLDKQDASGIAYGGVDTTGRVRVPGDKQLFMALNRRLPRPEPTLNFSILGGVSRPPTSLCVPSDSRTPIKPVGWRD